MSDKREIGMFPSEFASVEQKSKEKWLLQYARAIDRQSGWWGMRDLGEKRANIARNRRYVAGTQDPNIYRSKIYGEKNFAGLNLFINTSSPLGTIVNNIVGQLRNQGYKARVKSVSPGSQTEFDKKLNYAKADNEIMKRADELKALGVKPEDYVDSVEIYENNDELEMHFEMNFKDNAALALSIALQYVFDVNRFDLIENRLLRDAIICGTFGVAVDSFKNGRLIIRAVDPANFGSSLIAQEDYSDAAYAFEYRMISINQLAVMAPSLSEEDLFQAALTGSGQPNSSSWIWSQNYSPELTENGRPWGNFMVGILDYKLKSTNNLTHIEVENKRAGGTKIVEVDEKYSPKKSEKLIKTPIERRYKGKYIIGTEKLFDFGLDECSYESTEDGGIVANVGLGYYMFTPNIYGTQNSSMVDNLIALVDEWIFLKLHGMRLISGAHPAGVAMNMAAVAAAANGFGEKNATPRDMIDLFTARGFMAYSTVGPNARASIGDQNPIRDVPESTLVALANINNQMMAVRAEMEVVSGVPFSTITEPDKDGLVGNARIALLNRNNSLRWLDLAYRDVLRRTSQAVLEFIQDQVQKEKGFKNFGMAIGYVNVDLIEALKRVQVERFGIMVETTPDVTEQEDMRRSLDYAVQRGMIRPSAVAMVGDLIKSDPVKARRVLAIEERKTAEADAQKAQANATQAAEATAQAGTAVEQAKSKTIQIQSAAKIQEMHVEYKLKNGQSHQDYLNDMKLALLDGQIKKEQIELAMSLGEKGTSEFDKKNLPKEGGVRFPSVTPTIP